MLSLKITLAIARQTTENGLKARGPEPRRFEELSSPGKRNSKPRSRRHKQTTSETVSVRSVTRTKCVYLSTAAGCKYAKNVAPSLPVRPSSSSRKIRRCSREIGTHERDSVRFAVETRVRRPQRRPEKFRVRLVPSAERSSIEKSRSKTLSSSISSQSR